ncbi:hypothetical protein [Tenacibaculum jejuense]|uniref:PepSY-associated TM helix n=1 Tax=Tenacibaculum jejuense TaxID=584609 RepID=A0A238U6H0_9FLAO|nr:hypothetical protein [Tenacibaculum jejuense]SNR14084.1 conserved protein of unknown function [Tenacibaculum jejuense]
MSRKLHLRTRKTHRYLGLFIGAQFLFWTIGGLYFSWNNMKDVHGKTLLDKSEHTFAFQFNEPVRKLLGVIKEPIKNIEGIVVHQDSLLRVKTVSKNYLLTLSNSVYAIKDSLTKDHEYREKPLPVYVVELEHSTNTKVYVHPQLAKITSVRNDNWRRFDFLWMLHVMDFETRDHITNWTLRIFSVLGLATILSGFYLFYLSSSTIRKLKRKM